MHELEQEFQKLRELMEDPNLSPQTRELLASAEITPTTTKNDA